MDDEENDDEENMGDDEQDLTRPGLIAGFVLLLPEWSCTRCKGW